MAIGIAFIFLLSAAANSATDQICLPKELALTKAQDGLQVKEPKYLPQGYRFVCSDVTPGYVLMFYGDDRPLEPQDYNRNGLIENGAILVGTRFANPQIIDKNAYIESMAADAANPDIKNRLTEINGNIAAVRDQCQECGKGVITWENGTTLQTGTFSIPTVIMFFDGNQEYRLEAYMPSEELEKVAKSLD